MKSASNVDHFIPESARLLDSHGSLTAVGVPGMFETILYYPALNFLCTCEKSTLKGKTLLLNYLKHNFLHYKTHWDIAVLLKADSTLLSLVIPSTF